MAQVHPLLTRARELCEAFTVRPHERGFVIWRNRDWSHARGGWRPDAFAASRESAEAMILSRFPDLAEPKPPAEQPLVVIPQDAYFDFGGYA